MNQNWIKVIAKDYHGYEEQLVIVGLCRTRKIEDLETEADKIMSTNPDDYVQGYFDSDYVLFYELDDYGDLTGIIWEAHKDDDDNTIVTLSN